MAPSAVCCRRSYSAPGIRRAEERHRQARVTASSVVSASQDANCDTTSPWAHSESRNERRLAQAYGSSLNRVPTEFEQLLVPRVFPFTSKLCPVPSVVNSSTPARRAGSSWQAESRYACREAPARAAAAANTRLISGHFRGSMSDPCVNASYLPRDQRFMPDPAFSKRSLCRRRRRSAESRVIGC